MYSIDLMVEEHKNIVLLTDIMEKFALKILNEKKADYKDLEIITEFIKKYSDFIHHGKEEKILFKYMVEYSGNAALKLVNNGMLVEHDLGRMYVSDMKNSIEKLKNNQMDDLTLLGVISHVMEYANLLRRHANKENDVVYPFALRTLKQDILDKIDEETKLFEEENKLIRESQLNNLSLLKNKYL